MTIQIPNPGTGNGQTGDNEFALWSKVKSNFEDQSNAASRLVGKNSGQVTEMTTKGISGSGLGVITDQLPNAADNPSFDIDANHALQNGIYAIDTAYRTNNPTKVSGITNNFALLNISSTANGSRGCQVALPRYTKNPFLLIRGFDVSGIGEWVEFYNSKSTSVYTTTTASGANVAVDATGKLMRSTSSERYKDITADLKLDDDAYNNAMQLAPIVYRSTAEADNPDYHYYSFSAEALGAFDPAFTLWRDTETVTDAEGNTIEQPLAERVAEGININALLAFSHAIAIKQDKMIKAQAEAIKTLNQRIDAMTAQ